MSDEPEQQHGPEMVCYTNGPYGYKPTIYCLCGWTCCPCDSWEEAGQEFDEHLEGIGETREERY